MPSVSQTTLASVRPPRAVSRAATAAARSGANGCGCSAAAADRVPWLDIAGVHDANAGTLTFFAVNRHGSEAMEADLSLEGFAAKSVEHTIIRHDDLEARNTRDAPETVVPARGNGAVLGGKGLTLTLPPYSYSMVRVAL